MNTFLTPTNETIFVRVIDIDFPKELFLTIEVSFETYLKIDTDELFNFYRVVRNQTAITFEPDKNVELRLTLRSNFTPLLQHYNVETFKVAFYSKNKDLDFLYQTENWLLYSAAQVQDLPEALKGSGVLKLGIQTKYEYQTSESPLENSPMIIAKQFFFQKKHPFEEVDKQTLRTEIKRQGNTWLVIVHHNPEMDTTMVYSVLPERIAQEYRSKVATFLVDTNFHLGIGAFEMDINDGEVRFRTSIAHSGHPLDLNMFQNLFLINIQTMGDLIRNINALIIHNL
jgi:hypothetical protein